MTPLEASRAMYAHVARGEWDAVETFMADDFVIHEPASLPYGGEWRGKDALKRLYAQVMGYWTEPRVAWRELVGGEDYAVAILTLSAGVPGGNERFTAEIAEVTRFEGGKMAEMRIHYFDTAALVDKLGS